MDQRGRRALYSVHWVYVNSVQVAFLFFRRSSRQVSDNCAHTSGSVDPDGMSARSPQSTNDTVALTRSVIFFDALTPNIGTVSGPKNDAPETDHGNSEVNGADDYHGQK